MTTGTLLDVSALNTIRKYDESTGDVTCEEGVKMADLADWLLDEHDRELSFCPEIGDATVGSLTVATSKDSSANGPGHLSALVKTITYVNENGDIVTLERDLPSDSDAFHEFICSFGMMGIVVEVVIETRPAQKILTKARAERESRVRGKHLTCSRHPGIDPIIYWHWWFHSTEGIVYIEERYEDTSKKDLWSIGTYLRVFNPILLPLFQRLKFFTIQQGAAFSDTSLALTLSDLGIIDTLAKLVLSVFTVDVIHRRKDFTNRYDVVTRGQDRLDFAFYAYDDISTFEATFKDIYDFTIEWYEDTGYAPKGFLMYFVTRTGRKPFGEFQGDTPGVSFVMGPYEGDPESQGWQTFITALNARSFPNGARMPPSQTRFLKAGDFQLQPQLAKERFLTPHYAKFV